jgi:hypothetical protein
MHKIFLTMIITAALHSPPALAVTLPEIGADESFSSAASTDGKSFVDKLRAKVLAMSDYSMDSALFMYKPTAEQVAGGNICWKRVNLVKLTVKSKGLKDGSVVVRQPDGQIKGRGGPFLRFLKMNLTEDSRILVAPNGYNAMKSDLGNLLTRVSESLAAGNKARVTVQPVEMPRLKQNVYVLQIYKPSPTGDVIAERIFVDPATNIPVEWDLFKDGVRYSIAVFENFKQNIGLEDSAFQI